jgi:inhibitor of cysteine peptidase
MEKQTTFKAIFLMLVVGVIILGVYLFSGDDIPQESPMAELVNIDSVDILILESFPVQVNAVVKGYLPNPCWSLEGYEVYRNGDSFEIDLYAAPPLGDTACIQVVEEFEESISIDVYGLSAGTYNVMVNGAQSEFTLDMDNVLLEESGMEDSLYKREVLAGKGSPFLDFHEEDYLSALDSDKTVFLYFYAKWCPTCKKEIRDSLVPAFNEYQGDDFVAFRVNYNDRDTDDLEESLAEEFGVLYQHTKVVISDGEVKEVFPNSWTKEDYLSYLNSN